MSPKAKKKAKILGITYLTAAILALGIHDWARSSDLNDAGRAASYSAGRAFEETVNAVEGLSDALAQSVYATDSGMRGRICSRAYACAEAAEAALSTLPFSTQELERISAFLNVAGDYSAALCAAPEEGFREEQLSVLTDMSGVAASLADSLRQLQGGVHAGEVVMDRTPLRLQNIKDEDGTEDLSARLLAYEAAFEPLAALEYDGKYGCAKKETRGYLTEGAMLKAAADYAGVAPEKLREVYDYEGSGGRRCYRTEDLYLCVSRAGVESMCQSRLVGEALLDETEARQRAERFLAERGYTDLTLTGTEQNAAVLSLRYCRTEGDAVCLDNGIQISVALDDGSIYGFQAADYCAEPCRVSWTVDEETAAQALPASLVRSDSRKVILKSPGKRDLACYDFSCQTEGGETVNIYVDAATGKQCKIEL